MAKYDLKLKTTDAGTQKARTLTLSNVNPEASANTLKLFTQQLNQLTTNTYVETDYIVTTNLDTETPPIDTRQTPTISVNNFPTLAQVNSGVLSTYPSVSYNGDGVIYVARKSGCLFLALGFVNDEAHSFWMGKMPTFGQDAQGGVLVIGAYGTDNYKPVEIEVTLE